MRRAALPAAIVVAALLSCRPAVPPHVKVDPAMLTLAPPDSVLLLGVRVDHLSETPFYQKYVASGPAPALDGFIRRTGIDPGKDVWEVLAAHDGKETVVMTRGKFSEYSGLEPRIEMEGASRTSHQGYTLVGDERQAITFMNSTTAVAGPPRLLQSIIDRRSEPPAPPAALVDRIKRIERVNQVWLVAQGPVQAPEAVSRGRVNVTELLAKVRFLTAAADLRNGMAFTATGECASPRDAETLESVLRAMMAFARLGLRDQPAMTAIYKSIALTREEATVRLEARLTADQLDGVIAELGDAAR